MSVMIFGPTLRVVQNPAMPVICFQATADEISRIATIARAGRTEDGALYGFQRPQIADHIREIRDFIEQPDAMIPNSIVLGFDAGARFQDGQFEVDVTNGPPGRVVDGQQRLTATLGAERRDFPLIVSAFICQKTAELNRQFILINNTRALPRQLIYELLPGVEGLPDRLSTRSLAALMTEALNFYPGSALRGFVHQQTNPKGIIKDTLLQKVILNSFKDGLLRPFSEDRNRLLAEGFDIFNAFFAAVRSVFRADWEGHTTKTSRLLHGVGIFSLGYVMENLHTQFGATTQEEFERGLQPLVGRTHWTSGTWDFGTEERPWNSIQNVSKDYRLMTEYLVRLVRPVRLWRAAE